jgi:NAD(P)-dependent dehydrogenase (short-subunit alcohol dehydrogenase family)
VAELALRILKDVGRVDILVNNVGFSPVRQMQAPEAIDVVNVNLLSHFWVSDNDCTSLSIWRPTHKSVLNTVVLGQPASGTRSEVH